MKYRNILLFEMITMAKFINLVSVFDNRNLENVIVPARAPLFDLGRSIRKWSED